MGREGDIVQLLFDLRKALLPYAIDTGNRMQFLFTLSLVCFGLY